MMKLRSDRIILGDSLFDGFLYADNGRITRISREDDGGGECFDFRGKYVSPGFIDMHTHGGGGYAFTDSSVDDVIKGCRFHLSHGTTSIVPTVSAGPFERMRLAVSRICEAKSIGGSNILGAHLEGPYLSPKQAGAQCPDFIIPPKKEEYEALTEEYGSGIVRWTYAPERDPDGSFCRYLSSRGILASAGHTDAVLADMDRAVENGCRLVTHLYSCTSTVTRDHGFRSLGVIESAFLRDDLYVEIIADGKHLPPELIQMIVKIKGTDRVALVTDSLEIAGTGVKSGVMSGTEFIVEDGVCKLKDRSAFAGSVAAADTLIRTLTRDCGYPVPTAVKMLTLVPAAVLRLPRKGRLSPGCDADIVVFDDDVSVSAVFLKGKRI